ncbi:unnamed protein product [Triticum turgidum subsp. durum]|uniref:DNA damage-binding protein 1 n=1 Tax=Triticum turgidum subsp. durum TaxID=4567 RepID=A0A9R1R6N7_TRITD|nr:unnamed protein product [Triticum turgidum subsp. durum]
MESSASGDGSSATTAAVAAAAAVASSSSGPSTSASAFSAGVSGGASATHYLAKRVLHGSAVQHVARGHFRSEHLWEIVLCKGTSLELVVVGEDGVLQSICEQSTFGIVKDVGVLDWRFKHFGIWPEIEGKEILVLLSDSGKLSLLYFCCQMHRFIPIGNIELSKPGNMRDQLGRILAIDHDSAWVAISAYEDAFAVVRVGRTQHVYGPNKEIVEKAKIVHAVYKTSDIRGTVWSMCFMRTRCSMDEYYPVVAMIINRKGSDANDLSMYALAANDGGIQYLSGYSEPGPLALEIAEIPQLDGFGLLFRAGDILIVDLRDPKDICCTIRISMTGSLVGEQISVEDPCRGLDVDDDVAACALLELRDSGNNIMMDDSYMAIDGADNPGSMKSRVICSWSWEPDAMRGQPRLIFCLDDGEFHILEFNWDTEGLKVLPERVHRGLPCKPLLWMDRGMIAGFVEMGDGMILHLEHGRLVHRSTVQNVGPILDLAIADYHGEKQDQLFSCCGMCPEGSLRVIRNGVNVEKLLRTEPIYQGVTGLWTLRMKKTDTYHSFLVLAFVEETRILSVGLSFNDISDAVGFQTEVCTLACGLIADGLLVQIHSKGVKLCLPTSYAHPEGATLTSPVCVDWYPDVTISVGAVGHDVVAVATSNPCCLYILRVRPLSSLQYELYETQHVQLQYEVSCISIPEEDLRLRTSSSAFGGDFRKRKGNNSAAEVDVRMFAVIGTHKPSVEVISLEPDEAFRLLSIGSISVNNALGAPVSGCIPENVRFVASERFYILAGLRNGMLLSDRSWLLYASRHSLAYSSISFLPASHVTPVSSVDCPSGLLFVAENCLHLVEMVHGKRLNAQKFSVGGTPRKVLYHSDSRTLLVMRTGLTGASCSSDIVQIDPNNGILLSRFKCELGETAKCIQIAKIGSEQVLIVGTSKSTDRPMMPNGEAESIKGRLIVLSLDTLGSPHECSSFIPTSNLSSSSHTGSFPEIVGYANEDFSSNSMCSSPDDICYNQIQFEQIAGHLRSLTHVTFTGAVLAVYPYLDRYVLAAAGNTLSVFGFVNENPHRMKKYAVSRTRFTITCLKTYASQIAAGDCRDGVLFYSYHENLRKLELVYADPAQRLVGDVVLLDCETAVVSDRRGSISVLSCPGLEVSESPEKNLAVQCSFFMGEIAMSIQKAAFKYRLPIGDETDPVLESAYNCVVASTLLGSVFVMIPLTSEEHQLLQDVQERLSLHPLTAPILGNDHAEFRRRGIPSGVPSILDGDMLVQFLELTSEQQQTVLDDGSSVKAPHRSISVFQVMRMLERVHYALN